MRPQMEGCYLYVIISLESKPHWYRRSPVFIINHHSCLPFQFSIYLETAVHFFRVLKCPQMMDVLMKHPF